MHFGIYICSQTDKQTDTSHNTSSPIGDGVIKHAISVKEQSIIIMQQGLVATGMQDLRNISRLTNLEQSFEDGLFTDLSKHGEAAVEEVHERLQDGVGLLLNDVALRWLRQ